MSAALDALLADVGVVLEWIVELDSVKRSDGTAATWRYSTRIRQTNAADTPANTSIPPYLMGGALGPLVQGLAEDALFGGAAQNDPGSVRVIQKRPDSTNDQLSQLHNYTFAGREVRIKVLRVTDAIGSAETFRTTTCEREPVVVLTAAGLEATWKLASALGRMLAENLQVDRYTGVPHCLRTLTTTGLATRAHNAVYDLTRFAVMCHFRKVVASAWSGTVYLIRKFDSFTDINYMVTVDTAGITGLTSSAGVANSVVATDADDFADGEWHSIVYSRDDSVTHYLMVDGVVADTDTPSGSTDTANTTIQLLARGSSNDDVDLSDMRVYGRYIPPDEARALVAVRADGDDVGVVAMWRCDDNGGGTINDYSANNLDATLGGVLNTDYSWQPTDLGEPELAGRPMPIVVGEVLNAQAHLIDSNRERYRMSAGDLFSSGSSSTVTVRSRGTVLTGGGTDYQTDSAGSDVLDMVAQEDEPVTFDHLNNGSDQEFYFVSEVANALLTEGGRSRLTTSNVHPGQVQALQTLCPWFAGYRTDTDATAQQALEEILGGAGLCYYEDAGGDLFMNMLLPPMGYGPHGEPVLDMRGGGGATFGDVGDCAGSFTIACWFKSGMIDQTSYAVGGSEPNLGSIHLIKKGTNFDLYFQAVGAAAGKFKFITAGTTITSPAGLIEAATYYFVAAVFDDTGNTGKVYVGKLGSTLVEVASGAIASSPTVNANSLEVGTCSGEPWCAVQHAQVWTATKSLADLQALMATPPVGNEANLAAYCPLNEGEGSPKEKVGGGTGTITTAQWAPKLVINLNETPSVKLTEFRHVAPAAEVLVRYARNRFPMSSADIDIGVPQVTNPVTGVWGRLELMREWKDVWLDNADNRSRFASARKVQLDSSITDRESAQRLARALMTRLGTDRYVGDLALPAKSERGAPLGVTRRSLGLVLMDEVGLIGSIPSQIATARSFRVVACSPSPLTMSTKLSIWG